MYTTHSAATLAGLATPGHHGVMRMRRAMMTALRFCRIQRHADRERCICTEAKEENLERDLYPVLLLAAASREDCVDLT